MPRSRPQPVPLRISPSFGSLRYTLRPVPRGRAARLVTILLVLVGYGHVARRFAELLGESRDALQALDIDPVIVGAITRHHGSVLDEAGLDASRITQRLAEGSAVGPATVSSALEWLSRIRSQGAKTRV